MTWQPVTTINPSGGWQLTEPVEGQFFKLAHTTSDLPTEYFRAELAQVEVDEDGKYVIFDVQEIEASTESQVIELPQPACFTERRLAIRALRDEVQLPPFGRAYSWNIAIEVAEVEDSPPDTGGSSGPKYQLIELVYQSNGDENGLFYWLGTNGKTTPWVNPATNEKLVITPSSILGGQSPLVSITDRQPSFFHTNGQQNPWVYFGIPGNAIFQLKRWNYRARSNASSAIPDRLIVSVAADGVNYTQVDDRSMGVGQDAWYISPEIAAAPDAKIIKFLLPANNYLTIGEFELYGTLKIPIVTP